MSSIESLKEHVKKGRSTGIIRLVLNTKVVGMRVRRYNLAKGIYEYADFDLDTVERGSRTYKFLKENQSKFGFARLKSVNGRLYTSDELEQGYSVGELESMGQIVKALNPIMVMYERGYVNVQGDIRVQ